MKKLNADMAVLAMLGALGGIYNPPGGDTNYHIDPSTRERTETCPECEKEHHRTGHIFCSDECHQIRKEKIKNGELK